MRENSLMIRVENVKKQYRLGQIGGGTLRGDLQSWWARKRGKEDPNTLIGTDQRLIGTTFMALNGVSFTVNKGEAVGIIGSSGRGRVRDDHRLERRGQVHAVKAADPRHSSHIR